MKRIKRMTMILGTVLLLGSAMAVHADESASGAPPSSSQSTEFLPNKTGTFPANVSVGGISLEGMTLDEANTEVSILADDLLSRPMHLTYSDQTLDLSAKDLGITWANPDVVSDLNSHVSRGNFIVRYKAMKELEKGPITQDIQLTGDVETVKAAILPSLEAATVAARNASVKRENGTFAVTPDQTGISYGADAAAASILTQALDIHMDSISYNAEPIITEPSVKADAFQNFSAAPLGSSTTAFLARDTARADNVRRSAEAINGKYFMPGEEISTLAMYGDVTAENGYNEADTYNNGAVVKGIGGGVCQTASTLYNAVLQAELQVTYRSQHSMAVDYLPPSMDAMVDYPSNQDFTFVNNTDHPIYIEAYCSGVGADGYDRLTINIYGTEYRPSNRTVNYRSEVLLWEYPGTLFNYVVDNSMKLGKGTYAEKQATVVNVHAHIKSQLYKDVLVDGQVVETTLINPLDEYDFSTGTIRHASDVKVEASIAKDGRGVTIKVYFLNGTPL